MLREVVVALAENALLLAAWFAPVAYFAGASFIIYRVSAGNADAARWLAGLFALVFLLILALLGAVL